MSVVSYLKRRVFGKSAFIVKRVVIPTAVVFLLLQVLLSGSPQQGHQEQHEQQEEEAEEMSNLIIPGEALDPAFDGKDLKHIHPHRVTSQQTKKPQEEEEEEDPKKKKKKKEKEENDVKKNINKEWSMANANITDSHKVKYKGHAITELTVTLTLMSSQDKVFMSLNRREIYRNLEDRGIHLVVINEYSGQVMGSQVFDTFSVGVEEEMVAFIDDISDGRILVFAVLDEASKNLSWRGRNALKDLGSRWADKLAYRDMWALVTRKGGLKMAETYSNVATADTGYEWGGPVFLRTDFDLKEGKGGCKWSVNERNDARRVFCNRFEGYGSMCDCKVNNWRDVFFHIEEKVHRQVSKSSLYRETGVVILATDRPHYLYRTLKALWEAPGVNRDRIAVYSDGGQREITAVCKLFGVHLVETERKGNLTRQRIRHKVQRVFRDVTGAKFTNENTPDGNLPQDTIPPFTCSNLLLLEDDVQVSIDIFKFLYTVGPVMEKDPTILAISSFNYYGYTDVSNSLTSVYRTDSFNPLALYLPSKTIHTLASTWPDANSTKEWYRGLSQMLSKGQGRALLYPEVPRAKHTGYRGELIIGSVQLNYFHDQILALTTDYDMTEEDVMGLEINEYDRRLERTLKESETISFDFCQHDLLYGKNPLKIFVSYNGSTDDEANFSYTMKCLRTWELYPEAGWNGVWQLHYHGHLLSIIATPLSKYSYLKPENYVLVTAPPANTTTTTTPSPIQ